MGWVGDQIDAVARRVAAAAADLPVQRAVAVHAQELRNLVGLGVPLKRLCEALALAGVVGPRTGKVLPGRILGRMLSAVPDEPPAIAPPSISAPIAPPPSAPENRPAAPPPAPPPFAPTTSRAGRGLESLVGRKPKQ